MKTMKKMSAGRKRRIWQRWAIGLVFICGLLSVIEFLGHFLLSRSIFIKVVPRPQAERVEFTGSEANGMILDGHGDWFNEGRLTDLFIESERNGSKWDRPSDIIIRNMKLRGSIRIMGMGPNGEGRRVRESSHVAGHTARAQAAAPTRILISHVDIQAAKRIPLYLAPGVTCVTVEDCEFTGWSISTAVYLDAESGHNIIRNNRFAVYTGREVLAVDGSAENCIESNRFDRMFLGGIYLYRNCGEGGTVRHQTPHGNIIRGNRFVTTWLGWGAKGIWIGSRNGGYRRYGEADAGYEFGSSIDNRDFANSNIVVNNIFTLNSERNIMNRGEGNRIMP
jgi:hypothetical protein